MKLIEKLWWNKQNKISRDEQRRHDEVMEKCGCVCLCPFCNDILNDQADCKDDQDGVFYKCNNCGKCSHWDFDLAPIPVLLTEIENKGASA